MYTIYNAKYDQEKARENIVEAWSEAQMELDRIDALIKALKERREEHLSKMNAIAEILLEDKR